MLLRMAKLLYLFDKILDLDHFLYLERSLKRPLRPAHSKHQYCDELTENQIVRHQNSANNKRHSQTHILDQILSAVQVPDKELFLVFEIEDKHLSHIILF